jgi:flagellar hook-associated protein FlgK
MTDLVSVASNAVASYQRALGTVSNNIANVATEGYSRQEVVLQANPTARIGNVYLGTGVTIDRVKRQYDTFAELNLRNSNSELASQEPMVNYANRVIDIMGSGSMGLNSSLDQFFNTARELSADPASTVRRSSFIRDAEGVASRFSQLSSQLDLVQQETNDAMNSYVNDVNTLTKQLAEVNQQMTKHQSAESQPPDLLDQRDLLLKSLSSYAHIKTQFNTNGSVNVSLGASFTREVILEGNKAYQLQVTLDDKVPEKINLILDPYGEKPQPLTGISSGKISGMLSFREQILGSSRNAINDLATKLATEINKLHEAGIDAYGNAGVALFKISDSSSNAAANLQVTFDDPLRVAAANQFRAIEASENTSAVDASLVYVEPTHTGPAPLQSVLANSADPGSALPVKIGSTSTIAAVATIPNGLHDVSLYLSATDSNQQLQIFTRDGRQIAGKAITNEEWSAYNVKGNGFVAEAKLNTEYINKSGGDTYKDFEVFYGAKAEVKLAPQWDMGNTDPTIHTSLLSTSVPATLTGQRIPADQAFLPGGRLKLNGVTLGEITSVNAPTLQATDFARGINELTESTDDRPGTGVTAVAQNSISVPASQLNLNYSLALIGIYGQSVSIADGSADDRPRDINALIARINAKTDETNVIAKLSAIGELVLTNAAGYEGENISLDGTISTNILGVKAQTYTGWLTLSRPLSENGQDSSIVLEFEGEGTPVDLSQFGISTAAYIRNKPAPAILTGERITAGLQSIAGGKLQLNGIRLTNPITPADATTLQATDFANAINAIKTSTGVTAVAENYITVPASQINLSNRLAFLAPEGTSIDILGGTVSEKANDIDELIWMINAKTSDTHVVAEKTPNGDLLLINSSDDKGKDIKLDATATPNALGLKSATYTGWLTLSRPQSTTGEDDDIVLTHTTTGTPADLTKLGISLSSYARVRSGQSFGEDLLVFVTGNSGSTASVSATYEGTPTSAKTLLREQQLEVKFQSPTDYTIVDTATNTQLASRTFDPLNLTPGINYLGLQISFSSPPKAGDVYRVDGNKDGTGNNENILLIAALETAPVASSGKTIGAAYIDHVNDIGNIARQAAIAKEALTVVHDQAVAARDQVSGVSLDDEAAELIRYQQAYQAAAKILQISSQLFDSVLQVR